jgi:hypothetical protein
MGGLVDGQMRYHQQPSETGYWEIDLRDEYSVNGVTHAWADPWNPGSPIYTIYDYEVQAYVDGSWTTVDSVFGNSLAAMTYIGDHAYRRTDFFASVTSQRFRFKVNDADWNAPLLTELQLHLGE